MKPAALVVTTGMAAIAPARMPRELQRAGFHVTLLAPRAWEGPRELPAGSRSRMALFPQEWYRDPESPWLRTLASDAPWDDPDLLNAMVAHPRAAEDLELRSAAAGGS